ncbi:DnaJ C-terminal domain-containing protein [Rhodopirellula sallentina]|uniref:Heat shock protein DnaJ domain-containing protein n=1 Tax=Rhodopirellula sallentina SM41 TaxID=1263870 RepID=M5UKK8_9BACT|nr:J domain-containing protein [Rhodopirellula sallentina]EMI56553.1 heat shock protein DnaJ domain-containing protein [Rhodopirellula sallentina SM41]
MAEDLYQTLGVSRDADKSDLQKAYRKLARKYHPDMNPDDKAAQEKFKRVQEAYEVLGDEQKRAAYDRYGPDFEKIRGGYQPGAAGAGGGPTFDGLDMEEIFRAAGKGGGGGGGGFENGFNDFFEQILGGGAGFGGRGGARRAQPAPPQRGSNVRYELSIPFEKAVLGGKAEFYPTGTGKNEKLSVTIPAGIEDGAKIRLREQGQQIPGGTPGDLILTIKIDPHPYFERKGKNLELELPITIGEAASGAKVDVPTPKGTVTLSIPPRSRSGKRLRLKGQGVQSAKGDPGDLIVELLIQLPDTISDSGIELLKQFESENSFEPRAGLKF